MKIEIIWFSEVLLFFAYCNVTLSVIILFVEVARFSSIFPLYLLDPSCTGCIFPLPIQ